MYVTYSIFTYIPYYLIGDKDLDMDSYKRKINARKVKCRKNTNDKTI